MLVAWQARAPNSSTWAQPNSYRADGRPANCSQRCPASLGSVLGRSKHRQCCGVEMGLAAVAGGADHIAFAVVRLADLVGAPEAIAGVGLAVAAAHRPEAFALLARNAQARNGDAHALRVA